MSSVLKFSSREKGVALEAAHASDRLIDIWSYIDEGRATANDLNEARECIQRLRALERLIEKKLSPQVMQPANNCEHNAETSCGQTDENAKSPVKKSFWDKLVGLFH